FDPALHEKPRWLVMNKLDLIPENERDARVEAFVKAYRWTGKAFAIAAINGDGCRELVYAVQEWLDAHPAEAAETTAAADAERKPVVVMPKPMRERTPRRRRTAP
ncbi:MAG TPA: hypothetical protein VEO36_01385, partial [Casimicrobiaceae bacterium]|nr:hypothetical protein [Casimicrobiaceae bacterium]